MDDTLSTHRARTVVVLFRVSLVIVIDVAALPFFTLSAKSIALIRGVSGGCE